MSLFSVTVQLLEGFRTTFLVFALTLLFSLPLGLVIAFGSMSGFRPLRYFVRVFVWIIRGIPLMLQIFIIFYVPGFLLGQPVSSRFGTAIIAFSINYACYFSEIYRGGIESVSRSQFEAGQVLGMTRPQIFFRVILLQVIKRIMAPMSNEIITLVKDTALARVIMVVEILKVAENFASSQALIWPLFYTGAFYLLFVGLLTLLFGYTERKLGYFRV
ncbi:MAG: amino acid ABC transporter permease [Oscillospiraceae bacterium]|jgi:polar amino acid transport system permease protein|nr:amino acid ABC transporter permease [Oscillospiraceae bacterium]